MDDAALAEVIRRAQRGEATAFDKLVDAFGHRLTGFFYRLTGSRHDSEDLAQEVFVRLVRTIRDYHHEGRFEAWIFRIAGNLARDRVRKAKRSPRLVPVQSVGLSGPDGEPVVRSIESLAGDSEPADAGLQHGEEIDALNSAIARLSAAEREVIMLRHFSQMSFKEIAELTGVPLGTALARSHRGLLKLRGMMTADEPTVSPNRVLTKTIAEE